jgi:hypothetical protein
MTTMVVYRREPPTDKQIECLAKYAKLLGYDSPWEYMAKEMPGPPVAPWLWERVANRGDLGDAISQAQAAAKTRGLLPSPPPPPACESHPH